MTNTIRTEADLLNNIFPDNQADGSITAQDMRDLVASTRYLQPLGWQFRFDSQYTEGSPLVVTNGNAAKVTFTDNLGEDLRYPSTFPEIWDNATQKMVLPSSFLNGFGIVRLSFLASAANAASTHLDMWIDIGANPVVGDGPDNAVNRIYYDSPNFSKGNNTTQAFNFIVPLFAGQDFVDNGAQFAIQAEGSDVSIWQMVIAAGAVMIPNPAGEG